MVTVSDRMAGAEKSIYDLIRLIDKTKYDVRLVIFKHEANGELAEKVRELGIPVDLVYLQSKFQVFKILKLWKIIQEYKPDILESFLYFDNQVCRLMGKLAKISVVISGLQNIETKQSAFRKLIDRLTMHYTDAVISNSDAGKKLYINRGYLSADKIFIAKSGVDIDLLKVLQSQQVRNNMNRKVFDVSIPEGYGVLFTVGFLVEQKGTEYLIRALKTLKDQGKKVICFIAGQGHLQSMLENLAQELGISENVYFLGYVKASYQYLPLIDVFVLPSRWEGLPNVIIEAMASRVPVVATDVGGVSELVIDNVTGFLSEPMNVSAFAEKITQVLDLPAEERARILDAAYDHIVQSFTTDTMVAAYTSCYEQLLAARAK